MFVLRCAVVTLALLACTTQAKKCTTDTYAQRTAYYVPFSDTYSYDERFTVTLPVEASPCTQVVGSKVEVCVNDETYTLADAASPDVNLYQVDEADVRRYGANGKATVRSGVFCATSVSSKLKLGATHVTPTVTATRGKNY